jgi:hypothetical protein
MRIALLSLILLAGCATKHELSYVTADAPQWNVNPDRWNATTNAITTAPTPGSPMVHR